VAVGAGHHDGRLACSPVLGVKRLVLTAVVAALAFGAALVRYRDAPANDCLAETASNPAYRAQLAAPVKLDDARYRVLITRHGQPVTGARVCLNTFMTGMSAMGVIHRARAEVAPGVYELVARFAMAGPWEGIALVKEPGRPAVAVSLTFEVD
jgi:hypothetical protein